MKKNFCISIFILVLFATFGIGTAKGQGYWEKAFGGTSGDNGYSVQQTTDGGYIIAGSTNSFGAGGSDVYLIKTDGNGNKQWSKTFGGTGSEEGRSVQQTTDGGYIIAGSTNSFGAGGSDVYLIKTDGTGNKQWSKTYGGTGDDGGNSVQQTTDGGYIIVGVTWGDEPNRVYLIKTDGEGNEQWSTAFYVYGFSEGKSVRQTADGGYIIAGEGAMPIGIYGSQGFLCKTDDNGNTQWDIVLPTVWIYPWRADGALSVQQTSDGGYISVGYTRTFGAGDSDVYLIKIDGIGNKQWSKTFGGTGDDGGYSVQQTTDGGYIIAGNTDSSGAGGSDVYLIRTDGAGIKQWSKTFGGTGDDSGNSVQQTTDGGYIIAGTTSSFGAGDSDVYLIYYKPSFFVDIPQGYWAYEAIYKIYNAGITTGCSRSPLRYCPEDPVTRAQMAVFLGKGIHGSSFTPPAASGIFSDVSVGYWAAKWIEQFYNDGITGGCGTSPLRYCPEGLVTRAQMAIFLLRAKHGSSYTPPPATGIFNDVPTSYWAADWIEQLYKEGITTGCSKSPLRYCPENSVTRAQMAVFLARTFGLSRIQNPDDGHWYQRFDNAMTWHDAKDHCEGMDGYLATITSQQENQFIYDNLVDPIDHYCWLGGTDEENEGTWQWITGEAWEYSNWDPGEPNDDCGGEDYLHIHYSRDKWNDQNNTGTCGEYGLMYPICEWE